MKIPRSKVLALAIGLAAAGTLGLAACGYDWSVGPAAQLAEGGVSDAASDASMADATPKEDADAASTTPDAAGDALVEAALPPSCAELAVDLSGARTLAKECKGISSGECTTYVLNECHCQSYVAMPDASATATYVAAIGAFLDAGCSASCDAGCTLIAGACISNPDLSGTYICD
jgi:hypothetical protein